MINLARKIVLKNKKYPTSFPFCRLLKHIRAICNTTFIINNPTGAQFQTWFNARLSHHKEYNIYHSFRNLVTRLLKCNILRYPLNKVNNIDVHF